MSGEQRRPTATLAEDERDELKRLRRSTLADLPMLFDEIGMGIAKLEAAGNSVNPERDCLRIVSEVRDRWLGAGRESPTADDTGIRIDAALAAKAEEERQEVARLREEHADLNVACVRYEKALDEIRETTVRPGEDDLLTVIWRVRDLAHDARSGHCASADPKPWDFSRSWEENTKEGRSMAADSSVDPDVERARNWLRSAKPHLYDLEGDEKDLDDDARQLAATLTYVRAEEREACALLFDYGPDGEAPGYDYLPECAAVIRARTAKAKAPKGERT